MTLSRCPRCAARGVRIADLRVVDGVELRFDYCGRCGKNWPAQAAGRADEGEPSPVPPPDTVVAGPWPGVDGDAG